MKFILLFIVSVVFSFVLIQVCTPADRREVSRGLRKLLVPMLIAVVVVAAAVFFGLSTTMKVI